jgi:hypothetical protein
MIAEAIQKRWVRDLHGRRSRNGLACDAFNISQTCYRHEAKLSTHNSEIADWLISQPNAANATIRDVRLVFRGPVATGIEQTR